MLNPMLFTIMGWVRWLLLAICIIVAAWFVWLYRNVPSAELPAAAQPPPLNWPVPEAIPPEHWQVFQRASSAGVAPVNPIASRFRLAGTFFLFDETSGAGGEHLRRAIVDDLGRNQQALLSEGDRMDAYEIARIFQDRIVLRSEGFETELWLSFSGPASGRTSVTAAAKADAGEEAPLETNRFGKRVGETRWVLSREEMLKYYQELLDDPERIAALFLSLKPDYKDDEIAGYYLKTEGEGEFFKAVGLQEGDTIRKVNSMLMTSQKRAEYFISEFIKNRVNAFVLDIERNGKEEKLIYLIR